MVNLILHHLAQDGNVFSFALCNCLAVNAGKQNLFEGRLFEVLFHQRNYAKKQIILFA